MKKIIFSLLSAATIYQQANACTAVSVSVYNSSKTQVLNTIGSRNMDFENGVAYVPLSFGAVGVHNISDVNMIGSLTKPLSDDAVAQWDNKYQYLGMTLSLTGNLTDGINNQGLYVGALYLPNETQYPEYNPQNPGKALAVYDLPNYILGNFASVSDAVIALQGVQGVQNPAVQVVKSALMDHFSYPLHFMIQDKGGDRAIIEFINGQLKIYHGTTYDALTNSPDFQWQINNYLTISQNFVQHNTDYSPADGMYENGSGYLGLPGDSTPVSRFDRAYALLDAAPDTYSDNQAYYVAKTVINSDTVGLGINPGQTLWTSTFNLGSGDYFVSFYFNVAAGGRLMLTNQTPGGDSTTFQHLNVQTMTSADAKKHLMIMSKLVRNIKYVVGVAPLKPTSATAKYTFSFPKYAGDTSASIGDNVPGVATLNSTNQAVPQDAASNNKLWNQISGTLGSIF